LASHSAPTKLTKKIQNRAWRRAKTRVRRSGNPSSVEDASRHPFLHDRAIALVTDARQKSVTSQSVYKQGQYNYDDQFHSKFLDNQFLFLTISSIASVLVNSIESVLQNRVSSINQNINYAYSGVVRARGESHPTTLDNPPHPKLRNIITDRIPGSLS